ncbi:Hypothetical protein, putative, partial [Bodo saltans]
LEGKVGKSIVLRQKQSHEKEGRSRGIWVEWMGKAGNSADKVFTIKKLQFFIPPMSADRVISLLYFSCVFGTLNIVRAEPGNKR